MVSGVFYNLNQYGRRAIALSFAVVGLCLATAEARAGVIVPWANERTTLASIDFAAETPTSSCASHAPAENAAQKPTQDESPSRNALKGLLAGALGGASAPVTGTVGQSNMAPAAVYETPSVVAPSVISSARLRERAPRLPQPPVGELLDPPKACA